MSVDENDRGVQLTISAIRVACAVLEDGSNEWTTPEPPKHRSLKHLGASRLRASPASYWLVDRTLPRPNSRRAPSAG